MATSEPNTPTQDDVLHLGSGTRLSAEEIAKAVAHHNRHHKGDKPLDTGSKAAPNKKKK